jgi:hypothetical protein
MSRLAHHLKKSFKILDHRQIGSMLDSSSEFSGTVMEKLQHYRMLCTLSFGDIYGQIIIWLIVIFLSLASALALWSSSRETYALLTVGLILVISLPFLLFAFVTTLLNHIELQAIDPAQEKAMVEARRSKRPTQV